MTLTKDPNPHSRSNPEPKAYSEDVQAAINDPRQLLQLIMDNIPQAVFWKDRDSVYVFCNQNFATDAGVGSPEAIRGKTDYDLAWTTQQAADFRRWDQLVMESGTPQYHIIEPQNQADGKIAWLETNKIPLFNEKGLVVGILGTYEDITERKNAEEEIRSSQQMLRLILDNIPQAVFWKDRNSVYLGSNHNFAVDAGASSSEETIGKTDYELAWNTEQAIAFREWDQQVMETGKPQYHIIETQYQADGKRAWLDTNKVPLYGADGTVAGILGTYEDITERINAQKELEKAHAELEKRVAERTAELSESNLLLRQEIAERKRVEEELRLNRERYTQAVKAGRVVVWDWDLRTQEFSIDPNGKIVLGIGDDAIPGTIEDWLNFTHPDDRQGVLNALQSQINGLSNLLEHEYRLIDGSQQVRWVLTRGTVVRDGAGKPLRMTGSTTDITELKLAEEELSGRDAILVSLAYASQNLLDLNRLEQSLPEVLSQVGKAVGVSGAAIYQNKTGNDDALAAFQAYAWSSNDHLPVSEQKATPELITYEQQGLGRWAAMLKNGECISGTISDFPPGEQVFLQAHKIRSIALVPIFSDGRWWGFLRLEEKNRERVWSTGVIGALKSSASALGAAFAQKRSQEAEREQRILAQALIDTSSLLNSTLKVEEVLDRILLTIGRVVPHDTANIVLVEGDQGYAARPNRPNRNFFLLSERPVLQHMMRNRQPLIIADTQKEQFWMRSPTTEQVRSYLGAPIIVNQQVIGFINLNSQNENFYTSIHAEHLQAFANQAAFAMNNARLYEQAQELAAIEERQRLARDLHDAVSQTLWTANLIGEVLPSLWEQNIEDGRQSLQKMCKLTSGALAEMRTLLLELRPAALAETSLDDLLRQLAEAAMSRKKIDVRLARQGNCEIPKEVKLVFYRIAQEGLNNIIKHSHAKRVVITLACDDCLAELSIQDDGRGFDLKEQSSGRLGLNIIQERAASICATVKINSQLDHGTDLRVSWLAGKGE